MIEELKAEIKENTLVIKKVNFLFKIPDVYFTARDIKTFKWAVLITNALERHFNKINVSEH